MPHTQTYLFFPDFCKFCTFFFGFLAVSFALASSIEANRQASINEIVNKGDNISSIVIKNPIGSLPAHNIIEFTHPSHVSVSTLREGLGLVPSINLIQNEIKYLPQHCESLRDYVSYLNKMRQSTIIINENKK
uniref:Putative secreted protein n=1 Tax=Panstrongylus lignarius TaxID=156445 RepID=A0A224XZY1_9HEMI